MSGKLSQETQAVVRILAMAAKLGGIGKNSYIVGGAVRDFALGFDGIKDVDVVVDSTQGGSATHLADCVRRTLVDAGVTRVPDVKPDGYGVVHLGPLAAGTAFDGVDISGQKLEIVTARKEKYDKSRRTESHKPVSIEPGTITDDIYRRDFTVNTLCWSLSSIDTGTGDPTGAEIIDLTGRGLGDLADFTLDTPLSPKTTFDEDPSRMLRGVRFAAKYRMHMTSDVMSAIRTMSQELRRLPYEAVDIAFEKIVMLDDDRREWAITMLIATGLLSIVKDMVPATRLRRMLQNIADIAIEIRLCDKEFPVPISALSEQHVNWLRFHADKLPERSSESYADRVAKVNTVRSRFLKPPFDASRYMLEEGKSGKEVGDAVKRAREELLFDPHVDEDELYRRVVRRSVP